MATWIPCAVPNCEDRKSSRHRFPNPTKDLNRYMTWMNVICNQNLQHLEPAKVYASRRVCHQHFTPLDILSNNILKKTAVPSQNLPIPQANTEVEVLKTDGISDIPMKIVNIAVPDDINQPSRKEICVTSGCDKSEDVEIRMRTEDIAVADASNESMPSTSREGICVTPPNDKGKLLRTANASRSNKLTPKAKSLYHRARKLENAIASYRSKNKTLKSRLKAAKKHFPVVQSNLRKEALDFCVKQLSRKKCKAKGRRYTTDEKIMSLALYKASGSGYRFLSQWFNLPSQPTLERLLHNVPIDTGIDTILMENLSASIKHFKPKERFTILMFDEIALMPQVTYNKYKDQLLGINNKALQDHALVFMVRGVARKWKQTVAYKFCRGTTSAVEIKKYIISLVQELKRIGLIVIAVICDQGTTNQSAIESLVRDAKRLYIIEGKHPKRRILLDSLEITPLYDVPHLLKGMRNNLLQKDLIWNREKDVLTAKWQDIFVAYQIDASSGNIRAFPRITEFHVDRNKLKKMKVSYATQVFSHSVAACISIMARTGKYDLLLRFFKSYS